MPSPVTVTRHGSIALVALNNPPVNALSHAVRVALLDTLKELFVTADVDAIVIACEGRTFVAGADIREFGKPPLDPDLPELVEFLDSSPKLTLAAIHGTALGGGLELALACHFRIAAASAKLGLPEVTLGILPGAGGTQRLPRLIGVRQALDLIVGGTPIGAAAAQRLGLIDEVVGEDVKAAALEVAGRLLSEPRALRRISSLSASVDEPDFFVAYERSIADRCRGFLAPFRCVDAVRAAVELPFDAGLERERALFRELMASTESKAQRHLFFGEREVAKVPGLGDDTPTRAVKSVAIIGGSALGDELARCFLDARIPVALLTDERRDLDGSPEAKNADLLIEAVSDDLKSKRAALSRLASIAKPGAILATTTSSLGLDDIARDLPRATDLVSLHFATPLNRSKLLEVERGAQTASDAYLTIMKLGRSLGKIAVPTRGHVARTLLTRCAREVALLRAEGASVASIDRTLIDFGFSQEFLSELAAALAEKPTHSANSHREISDIEILERCLFSVVNAAARALENGSVARPLDIDMIGVHGLGFPVYRGGPMFFADAVGLSRVHASISRYREHVGEEDWSPAPLLERLARDGKSFYGKP